MLVHAKTRISILILKAKTFYFNRKRRGSRPLIVINPLPKYG